MTQSEFTKLGKLNVISASAPTSVPADEKWRQGVHHHVGQTPKEPTADESVIPLLFNTTHAKRRTTIDPWPKESKTNESSFIILPKSLLYTSPVPLSGEIKRIKLNL